ncbi:flagellar hook-length control protein FliK [Halomonas sp. MCCC 1A11057]|uniref:flagellar hook-length control protein FliK n=1 Tax=Halomonas sp. MCCC 1A11057 TaxID=2733482 RepID=UPI001F16BF20|nr:flagellar hook-length control protein FliK [Halomonas sp. MCCC 1A11057]
MSGITPLLDTLLHQVLGKRVDTAPPRELTEPVRPVDPGEGPRALHSDSRLEGRRPATAPLQGASTHAQRGDGQLLRGDTPQAPASFQTHFSPSARTIADLLLRFPAPPSVLSAKAPLMNAGETPGASTLADRLQSSVRDSGLFYESHLARWYRGEMSRQQLGNEPQMLRTQRFAPAVSTTSGAPMQAANAAVAASNAQSQVSAGQMQSGAVPGQVQSGQVQFGQAQFGQVQSGQSLPGQAASMANTYAATESLYPAAARGERAGGEAPTSAAAQPRDMTPAGMARGEGAESSGREGGEQLVRARPAGGEVVHESLQGVVRHQLEMLVTPVLRWEGDVWSGIFMALMIQMPAGSRREEHGEGQEGEESQQGAWHSELQLSVPSLGDIRVAMWLQDQQVRLQLLARDEDALRVLEGGLPQLEQRLRNAGLSTVLIDARPWDRGEANDGTEA